MRTLLIAGLACAMSLAMAGCKSRKHEPPVPGPQVRSTSPSAAPGHKGSSGIAWFQGSVEEGFSRTAARGVAMHGMTVHGIAAHGRILLRSWLQRHPEGAESETVGQPERTMAARQPAVLATIRPRLGL